MMRMLFLCWFILVFSACQSKLARESVNLLQAEDIALSDPQTTFSNPFFEQKTQVPLSFAMEEVDLAYVLNRKQESQQGIYQEPLALEEDFTLKVIAQHEHFKNSDTLVVEGFRVDTKKAYQILSLEPAADKKYSAGGKANLLDRQKAAAYVLANGWLGFNGQRVQIDLKLEQALSDFTCILSCFVNQNAWVFAPEFISVSGSLDGESFVPLGTIKQTEHAKKPQFMVP